MSAPSIEPFEKLASFYLGRHYDLATGQLKDDLLMYDAKDLCTHAMCVGMTGSGKTGLCVALLEEAALDGVPAICVDPKGDLTNLMLAFPQLRAEDFEPWVEQSDADRKGMTREALAAETAQRWSEGLASWGQTPERIQRLKDAVDVAVYTPGSSAGLPLTVLKSFDAPPKALLDDADAMRERVTGATSGLLMLLGIEADPLLSPEHILISSILDARWRAGNDVTVADLIGLIQRPPMTRIGILDLDSFMPPEARTRLAMQLNSLLASPAFSTWLEGESLSISRLLYTSAGKPRLTILSIAHLNDAERMFFVTVLLNELVVWMRTQNGTGSLRALFYMDEVAGYFPPSAKPPSKPPMLTLLKQARAYGLGIMLATQNPVDLDYKALSNIGTWFLGRLQTERDKARVLEGLEGAAVQTGSRFDRATMEQQLAALGNRVFLMNNVHDDEPTVFQSRWAMSFLAGPLTRGQITQLMTPYKQGLRQDGRLESATPAESVGAEESIVVRPVVPARIIERFLSATVDPAAGCKTVYRAAVLAAGSVHYVRASASLDQWIDIRRLLVCGHELPADDWHSSLAVNGEPDILDEPDPSFAFADLPDALRAEDTYAQLEKRFKDYLYRSHRLTLFKLPALKRYAPAGCTPGEARIHFTQAIRELRDLESDKVRAKFAVRAKTLEKRIRDAGERISREQAQYRDATLQSAVSVGSTILGAFFGKKLASRTNVSKTSAAMRGASKARQAKSDVDRAEDAMRQLQLDLADLNHEIETSLRQIATRYDVASIELEELSIPPRKGDLKTTPPILLWTPWQVDAQGIPRPLYDLQPSASTD
ncbi:MAG: ATP-binding protein [Planctomycetaceae bacterium]